MIKAGIHGTTDTPNARDLVRLLLIHPDIQFMGFANEEHAGRPLWEDVFDIYGSTELRYARSLDLSSLDVLFCLDAHRVPDEAIARLNTDPEFRLIVFPPAPGMPSAVEGNEKFVYGIPELNRKAMVRGARAVRLATAPAMALLDAAFPIARALMLPSSSDPLEVHVEGPAYDPARAARESEICLRAVQSSFGAPVHFQGPSAPAHSLRGMTGDMEIPCNIDDETLRNAYSEAYSDHNFAFLLPPGTELPTGAEDAPLAGCNKCFISLTHPEHGRIRLRAAIDPRMKGAVGNAIHCMNLLFGLHERTGLDLKPGE
ncbi:MAG: hypothetical protein K2L96_01755 [Muribaculaceae bacterium]|nr:hypothetical protein [Muribaculaceae bacterium]